MKYLIRFVCLLIFFAGAAPMSFSRNNDKKQVHVLLITGGHDFDKKGFVRLMDALPGITYDWVEHPDAYGKLKADEIKKYEVVLLYDMPKDIPEESRADFMAMLKKGKGLVSLHHAFCSYDFWPEYVSIIGGRYHHYKWMKDGVEQPVSTYKHDVAFAVEVEDASHPVTKGVSGFRITDETYGRAQILPTVHPLLSTKEPTSSPLVGWANRYGKSRVVTLLLGHDAKAWVNPSFQKLLTQAIRWTAKK